MGCNCKVTNSILGILVIVFALWQTAASTWIVVIAGALVLIHALACRNCESCEMEAKPAAKAKRGK